MANLASYLSALLAVIAAVTVVVHGLRTARQQQYFVAALVSLAGSAALAAPATLQAALQAEPIPHLVRSSSAALAMIGSFCLVGVVLYSTRSARDAARLAHAHAAILAVVVVIVTLCLYLSGVTATATRTLTDANLAVTAFFVIRFGYTGTATVAFLVLIHRTIRLPETSSLNRLSFRLAMAATSIALVHAVWTLAVHLRLLRAPLDQDLAAVILGAALSLLAVGVTAPVWEPTIHSGIDQFRLRRAHRALTALWAELADLRAATSGSSTPTSPRTGYRKSITDLHRYCVALRDLQRDSRRYAHPGIPAWVADAAQRHALTTTATAIITEAAELGTALDAARAGTPPRTPAPTGPVIERRVRARRATDPAPRLQTTPDLPAAALHLVAVGFTLRHSQLVAKFRRRALTETSTADSEPEAAP